MESFEEFIRGKRVVVVGPAPSIVHSRQREYIDGFDVIVRINKAVPIPETLHDDIGTRTDVLYNCLNTHEENGGALVPDQLSREGVKYVRCPYPNIKPFKKDIMQARQLQWGSIDLSSVDTAVYTTWQSAMNCRPNSGIGAILDLLQHPIHQLYITGFTFFKGGYYSAYRPLNEQQVMRRMDKAGNHNQKSQLRYMKARLKSDSRVLMDDALQEIIDGKVKLCTERPSRSHRKTQSSVKTRCRIGRSRIRRK